MGTALVLAAQWLLGSFGLLLAIVGVSGLGGALYARPPVVRSPA
jgi:hypothetical protein